jgi:mannose-6-phosphate isomerase-like protein (cupin superfamily)
MKFLLLLTLTANCCLGHSQSIISIISIDLIHPDEVFDNIHVHRIDGDVMTTQFIIWVKDSVRTHKHDKHSEAVYILEGNGKFYYNDSIALVKKGDFIFVPKETWHSVKVTSKDPMKVLSNQSPAFYGEDRIFKD